MMVLKIEDIIELRVILPLNSPVCQGPISFISTNDLHQPAEKYHPRGHHQ